MAAAMQLIILGFLALSPRTGAVRKASESAESMPIPGAAGETSFLETGEMVSAPFDMKLPGQKLFEKAGHKLAGLAYTRKPIWWQSLAPDFINNDYTQKFKVEEDFGKIFGIDTGSLGKKYKIELDEIEDRNGREHDIDQKMPLKIEPHMLTLYGRMTVTVGDKTYNLIKPHAMGANVFGKFSWRVVPEGDDENVLFTIQKSNKGRFVGKKASWRIFQGHAKENQVVYYGVGDSDDLDEPEFKFYRSKAERKQNKKNYVAKIEHDDHESDGEDEYKVKVKPGEDAVILLIATACLDYVADDKREPEPAHE